MISTLDAVRWTVRHGGRALKSQRMAAGWQRFLLMPAGRLEWHPVGVVGIIGTWNYPLFLNAPPSSTPWRRATRSCGNRRNWQSVPVKCFSRALRKPGVPPGLVTAVFGGAAVGRALVDSNLDKAMFTGGIDNGRRVLSALGSPGHSRRRGIVGVRPGDHSSRRTSRRLPRSALSWAAFVGCGQTCVAVKRVYVVGDARPWADALAGAGQVAQGWRSQARGERPGSHDHGGRP